MLVDYLPLTNKKSKNIKITKYKYKPLIDNDFYTFFCATFILYIKLVAAHMI
jgi:hypothetical protein